MHPNLHTLRARLLALLLLLGATEGAFGTPAARNPDWATADVEYYRLGDPAAPTLRAVAPGIALMGGGDWPIDAFRWLVKKAAGGHLVVLRATGGAELQQDIEENVGGLTSIETLVIHTSDAAEDPRVQQILAHADALFIGGGDQSNYVRAWRGTAINRLIDAHVTAGKPIGGTSAGLAILGGFSYGCLDSVSMTSEEALRNPTAAGVTLVRDFLHLPYLSKIITDSHFAIRDREGRLASFVARLVQEENDPSIRGLGIDEDTALLVDGDGIGTFHNRGGGYAWLLQLTSPADPIVAGKSLGNARFSVTGLGPESSIDFKTFDIVRPAFNAILTVSDGLMTIHGVPADSTSATPR